MEFISPENKVSYKSEVAEENEVLHNKVPLKTSVKSVNIYFFGC
jgi:hypothetical protein